MVVQKNHDGGRNKENKTGRTTGYKEFGKELLGKMIKRDMTNYREMYAAFLRLKDRKKEERDFSYIEEKGRTMKKDEKGKK